MVSALLTAEGAGAERGSDMREGGGHASAVPFTATAIGGRSGSVRSSANLLDLHLAYLEELGGPGVAATNPEQLFAAGYAACFASALFAGCERTQDADAGIQRRGPCDDRPK